MSAHWRSRPTRLVNYFTKLRHLKGPKLLYITQKGKGFSPAEADPVGYHALNKIEPKPEPTIAVAETNKKPIAVKNTKQFLASGYAIWRTRMKS